VLAIDPDIPPARQRVAVKVAGLSAGARVMIGAATYPAEEPVLWRPTPGRHLLRLVDEKGAEVDRVQVTVRGVSLRRTALAQKISTIAR
jgi:penicillin-binding protein 1C